MHRWDGFKVRAVGKRGWRRKWGERTWRQGEQRIVSSKGHGKGRATPQSNYCLSLSTNVFLSLLLVVLVYLTPSCPLTSPCFRFVRECVCASQQVTWHVIRVSGTELSHIDRARPPHSLSLTHTHKHAHTHTHSWRADWATDRTKHGLTAVPAFPLKGLITGLHHIWNSK